jgi:hypothetical protein
MPMDAKTRLPAQSIVLICALLIPPAAFAQQAVPGPIIEPWRFQVGVCTHFSQGKGVLERNLDAIKSAGIGAIRDEVGWGAVEREKDRLEMPESFDTYVRRAAARRVNVLLILDYGNRFYDDANRPGSPEAIEGFCRYCEFVVRHFGKDVRLYEIWNEWDIPIGLPERHRKPGTPESYFKLLKAAYTRIKAADRRDRQARRARLLRCDLDPQLQLQRAVSAAGARGLLGLDDGCPEDATRLP